MRAVRVDGPGRVGLVELPAPDPGPGELLVRVARAGICGTDRRLVAGGADPPRVPGHEAAGYLRDGTPVGIHPDVGCGRCGFCLAGFENRCPNRASIGLDRDGGLADHLVVPSGHAVPLEGVPVSRAPLLEPLACCLHAVSLLPVERDTPALVVGAGGMGILCMWALQAAGARVVVAQRSEPRREQAMQLGAEAVMGPEEDPDRVLGQEPLLAVVTAPTAEALRWALERVAVGGSVHAFAGMPSGGDVDANLVHYRHLSLVGSTGSRLSDYLKARDLVASGIIDLKRFPIASVSLMTAPEALRSEPVPLTLRVLVDVQEEGRS